MEKKTVVFNSKGLNGQHTTFKGVVEIFKFDFTEVGLIIRGPKGGLRHMVVLPDPEAQVMGQELMTFNDPKVKNLRNAAPELLKAVELVLALHDHPESQVGLRAINDDLDEVFPIRLDPMTEKQLRGAVAKAKLTA